ncbi:MAG: periplasmic nitrate reductase, NapE protein [Hyphomicrobiaceae bacterium]|nr:periplasmic nitrate reductase, NapE protein [Hyphomicrobiaceae bacterium]
MTETAQAAARRRSELGVFLALAIILAPVLSVAAVGSYGLAVWMYQMVAGPPSVATTSAAPPKP